MHVGFSLRLRVAVVSSSFYFGLNFRLKVGVECLAIQLKVPVCRLCGFHYDGVQTESIHPLNPEPQPKTLD